MGNLIELACRDVSGEQVSLIIIECLPVWQERKKYLISLFDTKIYLARHKFFYDTIILCRLLSVWLFSMWSLTWKSVEDILQVLIVFAVESLELDFALLFPERHILLRVLPVLVVLATSSEKDSESLYKRVKINRLINIFKVFRSHFLVLW